MYTGSDMDAQSSCNVERRRGRPGRSEDRPLQRPDHHLDHARDGNAGARHDHRQRRPADNRARPFGKQWRGNERRHGVSTRDGDGAIALRHDW